MKKSFKNSLFSLNGVTLAVDVGSSRTIICEVGRGVVLDQPSMVAIDQSGGANCVVGIGLAARRMLGRTPRGIRIIQPLSDGLVNDIEIAEIMIQSFIKDALKNRRSIFGPNVVACLPSGATSIGRLAIHDALMNAGASDVRFINSLFASAIGAGIEVCKPEGAMVVNIGAGITEIGVVSLGDVVCVTTLRIGGNKLDTMIVDYFRRTYNLIIGLDTAEKTKLTNGMVKPNIGGDEPCFYVRGIDSVSRTPVTLAILDSGVYEATYQFANLIVDGIKEFLVAIPPEIAADLVDNGIVLTGGSALLVGLDQMIADALSLKVSVSTDPEHCAVKGALASAGKNNPFSPDYSQAML